jgi:hypothetical protein
MLPPRKPCINFYLVILSPSYLCPLLTCYQSLHIQHSLLYPFLSSRILRNGLSRTPACRNFKEHGMIYVTRECGVVISHRSHSTQTRVTFLMIRHNIVTINHTNKKLLSKGKKSSMYTASLNTNRA